jgi:hypothetical protein
VELHSDAVPPRDGANELVHIAPVVFQSERAGLDPRLVQQVPEQAIQPVGLFVDRREEILPGGRVERLVFL